LELGEFCPIEFWSHLLFPRNLTQTSSAIHPYRIIPLAQEYTIEKGVGEHKQESEGYLWRGSMCELTTARISHVNALEETEDISSDA
jgi:hypothetical protein